MNVKIRKTVSAATAIALYVGMAQAYALPGKNDRFQTIIKDQIAHRGATRIDGRAASGMFFEEIA